MTKNVSLWVRMTRSMWIMIVIGLAALAALEALEHVLDVMAQG